MRLYSVGVAGVVAADGAAPRWWVWVGIVHLCDFPRLHSGFFEQRLLLWRYWSRP